MKLPFAFLCLLITLSLIVMSEAESQPLAPVIAAEARVDTIHDRIEALGTLQANESVLLTASVTETVSAIHFNDGQHVEAGTVLVEMRRDEEQALLQEAQSRFEEARRQYERIKPLQEGGAAPASLIDERLRNYETSRAQLAVIEARLRDRVIIAPFDGVLGLRNISVGALVTPGDHIVTLDDISVMKLDFSIPSTFIPAINIGVPIEARSRMYPGEVFLGEIASIGSRIDPVTRSVVIRALLPNPDSRLRPGALMTVDLLKNERSAVVIPEEAIVSEGTAKFVYVIKTEDGNKLEKREITSGARSPGTLEVISGLNSGELIVAHGTIRARQDMTVNVVGRLDDENTVQSLLRAKSAGAM